MVTFRRQSNSFNMEHDSATVALRAEEAFERMLDSEFGGEERFGDRADRTGADLECDLASVAELGDVGRVAKAHVEGR